MFNTNTIMAAITPHLDLSFGIALSLAVTVGCVVGIHENSITNTLLDWFIFALLGTLSTCLLTGTHPSYRGEPVLVQEPEESDPQEVREPLPFTFADIFDRNFFFFVGTLVALGSILQAVGLVNVLVSLSTQYIVPVLNQGWRLVIDSFSNSSCIAFVVGLWHGTLNVLSQGRDTFMEAVHHVTNVFSSNEVEVVETE